MSFSQPLPTEALFIAFSTPARWEQLNSPNSPYALRNQLKSFALFAFSAVGLENANSPSLHTPLHGPAFLAGALQMKIKVTVSPSPPLGKSLPQPPLETTFLVGDKSDVVGQCRA